MPNSENKMPEGEMDHSVLLGQDIRSLRKSKKWTLAMLSDMAGCSVGYLSEVERGERVVSIKFLRSIAKAFDVPLGWFFSHAEEDGKERGRIVRAQNRKRLGSNEDGLFEELLSPDLSGSFEMFLTRIQPGYASPEAMRRDVEEEGYLIAGQLTLTVNDDVFDLSKGDSFRLHNDTFLWKNNGETVAEILWVTSPPVY